MKAYKNHINMDNVGGEEYSGNAFNYFILYEKIVPRWLDYDDEVDWWTGI
jgi:hypothetical protein